MTDNGSGGSWLLAITDWLVELMNLIGPAGAGIAIALENLFPPLPSEAILPLAGIAASRGTFTLAEAIGWTTLGSLVGAFVLYGLGAALGAERLRRFADFMPLIHVEDVDRAIAWFQRHGGKAVFFGRMIPIFRSMISIPAGVARMPLWRFAVFTAAGSLIWNSVFVMVGYLLGEAWHIVEQYVDILQYVVIVAVIVGVAVFIYLRVRTLLRVRRAEGARSAEPQDRDATD